MAASRNRGRIRDFLSTMTAVLVGLAFLFLLWAFGLGEHEDE